MRLYEILSEIVHPIIFRGVIAILFISNTDVSISLSDLARDLCSLDTARLSVKVAVIVFVVNASQINFLSEISRETVSHFRMGEMKGFRLELQEAKVGIIGLWRPAVRLAFHFQPRCKSPN